MYVRSFFGAFTVVGEQFNFFLWRDICFSSKTRTLEYIADSFYLDLEILNTAVSGKVYL